MELISFFQYSFIQRAFVTGICIAILCAVLGMFLVLRKLSLIGDGLSHVSFGAIALGLFFGVFPLYVAIPVVIVSSLFILELTKRTRIYGDAAIAIVSSVGLAGGVILASISRGFNVDLMSYLFGNILAVSRNEMILSVVLSGVVMGVVLLFYYDLFSVTFNEEHARVSGIRVDFINRMLVVLTGITVVLSVRVVGIMLISSFLVLPAITALQIANGFKKAIGVAVFVSICTVILGISISFLLNIPTGATIVLVSFLILLLSFGYKKLQ